MSLLAGLAQVPPLDPPDFSRGDWWVQLALQLLVLWLLTRNRQQLREFRDEINSHTTHEVKLCERSRKDGA